MTTYNTYQEAKIANPESEIYKHGGLFTANNGAPLHPDDSLRYWSKCNPADHCIRAAALEDKQDAQSNTQELSSNSQQQLMDILNDACGVFGCIPGYLVKNIEGLMNTNKEYAKALSGNVVLGKLGPRTKVEHEKITSVFQLNADEMSNGVYGWLNDDGEFFPSTNEPLTVGALTKDNLYRKVERPIEWHEDAIEFAQQCKGVNTAVYIPEYDAIDVDGSMTREEACDYARILLEQEGE